MYAYTRGENFDIPLPRACVHEEKCFCDWLYFLKIERGVETYGVLLIASRGKGPLRGPKWINWGVSRRVDGLTGSIPKLVRFLGY